MAITFGSEYTFNSAATTLPIVSMLDTTHAVVSYKDVGNSGYGTAIIGVVSGNTISYGSEYVFNNTAIKDDLFCAALDATHFVVVYRLDSNAYCYAKIGTIANGNEITFGSAYQISTTGYAIGCTALDSTHFATYYAVYPSGKAKIGVVSSGNQITFGSEYEFNSTQISGPTSAVTLDSTHFVIKYNDYDNARIGVCIVGVVSSGNQITFGSKYTFYSAGYLNDGYPTPPTKLDSTHFVISYRDGDNSAMSKIGVIANGNQISYGSSYTIFGSITNSCGTAFLDSTHFVAIYDDSNNSNYMAAKYGTVSNGNQITYGDAVQESTSTRTYTQNPIGINSNSFLVAMVEVNTNYGMTVIGSTTSAPTVTTQAVTDITGTTATGNGNVTADGGATVTERGICWKTSTGPTTADSKATATGTTGAFTANITGLSSLVTYYVRAYAINSVGTSYGSEVTFTAKLSKKTGYRVRAYATNSAGTSYGDTVQVTTADDAQAGFLTMFM